MKEKILQNGHLLPALEAALGERYDVHPLWREADPQAFLSRHGARFRGYIASARHGADRAIIDALPQLRVISIFGVGLDAVDLDAARARGIPVGYTPDVLTDCVADTGLLLLLDVARGGSAADRFVRRGEWARGAQFRMATSVHHKRLGILGLGRIGRAIAQRAEGFDMQVRYHNRRPIEGVSYGYEPTLHGLAQWSDFLVIAAAGGKDTKHLVSAEFLEALGPRSYLINIARGSVVDEQALLAALRQGRIAGAGLDVYEDEPNVTPGLLALDNVVLLPHVASNTHETRQAMADLALANLNDFFDRGAVRVAAP
jgi:hydroxypyruvate reductase